MTQANESTLREIAEKLGDALELIDDAIAIREGKQIANLKDLDMLRAEIHVLTCRPQFQGFYRRRP
jgi:hypothetical protein